LFTATLMLLVVATGCATRREIRGQAVDGLDRKLSTFAYIEDGDLVDFIVATKATRYRDGEPYVPIEVGVANRGLKQLTLSRESFVLVDSQGNRYPAAGPSELMQSYEFLDLDQRLLELRGVIDTKYAAMTPYPSKFSPTRAATSRRSNLVRDTVSLPRFGYMLDILYFPAPSTGVKDQRFELFLQAPELPDPVFVKFEVK
jgi:hypothetical protein